jgi:hypothetical protein
MDYLTKHKKRIQRHGKSQKERYVNEAIRNFNEHLKTSAAAFDIQVTEPNEPCITEDTRVIRCLINNITLNDQRNLDEKYIHVPNGIDIRIGCYVKWDNQDWLIIFREHNSLSTHKTYVMRKCGQIFNFKYRNKVYPIPICVSNLTLYSDGMADRVAMSAEEGGRRITYPVNDLTKNLVIGSRIMLSNDTIYEIAHMDDFSRVGVVDAVLNQIFFNSQDDKENIIAWNDFNEKNEASILGDEVLRLGANAVYTNPFNLSALPIWEIDAEDNCVWIDTTYDNSSNGNVRLQCTKDMSYIGTTVTLRVTNRRTNIVCVKTIKIGGMF